MCVCAYTFVYRSTRHVVETQCRVHVIHILQKREKILHFFKRDALINTQEASERWKNDRFPPNEAETEGNKRYTGCSFVLRYEVPFVKSCNWRNKGVVIDWGWFDFSLILASAEAWLICLVVCSLIMHKKKKSVLNAAPAKARHFRLTLITLEAVEGAMYGRLGAYWFCARRFSVAPPER